MATQFYKRYIPPSSTDKKTESTERPSKKRKLDVLVNHKSTDGARAREGEDNSLPVDTSVRINAARLLSNANAFDEKNEQDQDNDQTEKKAKKKTKKHKEASAIVANADPSPVTNESHRDCAVGPNQDPAVGGDDRKSSKHQEKKRKEKSQAFERSPEDQANDIGPTNEKHKSVLFKYQTSTKLSESTADAKVSPEGVQHPPVHTEVAISAHGLEPLPQPEPTKEISTASVAAALPQWIREPTRVSTSGTTPFGDLPLPEETVELLTRNGYDQALPIQASLVPMLLPGPHCHYTDICISAATGSGKTLAYALPLLQTLKRKLRIAYEDLSWCLLVSWYHKRRRQSKCLQQTAVSRSLPQWVTNLCKTRSLHSW